MQAIIKVLPLPRKCSQSVVPHKTKEKESKFIYMQEKRKEKKKSTCHFVQRVTGIVHIDHVHIDWVVCDCCAEHAAQVLLVSIIITCERGQEPVQGAPTAPQWPDTSGLPIGDCSGEQA